MDGHADFDRVTFGCSGNAHEAGARLGHDVHPGLVSQGAVLAPTRRGHVDQPRVEAAETFVLEPKVVHGPGAEVLDDHVCCGHELTENLLALARLEVQGNRPFVAVETHESRTLALDQRSRQANLIAALGGFDLDDLGAEVSELHAAERGRHIVPHL
jgi:hypothetical protein